MSRIDKTIQIRKPVEQVFEFVTTPVNWPRWHPSSLAVSGAIDHSLEVGEQVTEEFLVAGRRGRLVWRVRESIPHRRWVIDGQTEERGRGIITYNFASLRDGTKFDREFVYAMPNRFMTLLDWLFIRRRIEAESAEALRRLKEIVERRQR
jgi:hypothetical protein